jgi:hypothetical protein
MKYRTLLFLGMVAALIFAGCDTPDSRIRGNMDLFNRLSTADQDLIKQGKVAVGFTPEMVKLALGEPDQIYTRTDARGPSESWVYTTYGAEGGVVYYRGYYHRHYPGFYPYWTDYPRREVVAKFRVIFQEGKVAATEELTRR